MAYTLDLYKIEWAAAGQKESLRIEWEGTARVRMYFLGGRAGGTGWDGCPRSTYGSDVPTPRIVPFVVAFGPLTDPLTMLAANSAASPLRKPSMCLLSAPPFPH